MTDVVHDRNRFERVLRAIREILTIVILAFLLYIMVAFASVLSNFGQRLGDVPAPSPTATDCPFGPGECGD